MEERKYKVSIIIPHYNQEECLGILLPSVANQTYSDYEVIIIDDCSPSKSVVDYIKSFIKNYENMRLIENTENMRFIRTVNKGIKLANGQYVCLLNADTEVRNNFIERNVKILDADSSIAALSCIIVDRNGKNWFSGGILKSGVPVNLKDDFEGIRRVGFVAGTAAFYRKEIFNKIGFFDEKYRMYHEDVEFGLRVKTKTSYKACVFSEKLVTHYCVGSIPGAEAWYLINRNHLFVLRKYYPKYIPRALLLFYTREVIVPSLASILKLRLANLPAKLVAATRGILALIRGTIDGLVSK